MPGESRLYVVYVVKTFKSNDAAYRGKIVLAPNILEIKLLIYSNVTMCALYRGYMPVYYLLDWDSWLGSIFKELQF